MIDWDSQWMPVPGHPDYDAHPSGAVRSRKRGESRELVGWLDGNSYHRVHLDDAHYATHAIIALTFHMKRRYVRKNVGVAVECDRCGREVSKLNIHRHKKTDYCNGRTTGRWQ